MAEHAHTTPVTLARRRHVRAAPGVMDRRPPVPAPTTFHLQLPRTEGDGRPLAIDWRDGYATLPGHPALPLTVDWTGVITPDLRHRIERDVDLLIALLDALDEPGQDMEEGDAACRRLDGPGDLEDAEWSGDECEPSDGNEWAGHGLTTVHGGVPA